MFADNRFMTELNLRPAGFGYSACGPYTKHHESIQNFRETADLKHIYKNERDKGYFHDDAAVSNSKDLPKRNT